MEGVALWLVQHYNGDKTKAVKVYADLFHLRARAGSFSNELNWNAAYNMDPILWWQSLFFSSYPKLTALVK